MLYTWNYYYMSIVIEKYEIFFCNLFLYFYSVTIVCIFSPSLHPTPASPTSLSHLYPPPWFCPCVLYSSSYRPLSPLSPPHSPVAIVTMFLISMSLVIFWFYSRSNIFSDIFWDIIFGNFKEDSEKSIYSNWVLLFKEYDTFYSWALLAVAVMCDCLGCCVYLLQITSSGSRK